MTLPPPPIVRSATPEDIATIRLIYACEVTNGTASFETEAPSVTEMQQRFEATRKRRLPYLVAEQHERVVGYGYLGPYRTREAYRFTLENSVYVDRQVRGQGVGRLLLEALIDAVRASQYRSIVAVIGDSDNLGSIRLHQRVGFRSVGVLRAVGYKHERWLDTVLMQFDL